MKKILCLLVLFCSLSAFATDYTGQLDVTVKSEKSTVQNQLVSANLNGESATFTIYGFWYGWIYCGDVTVKAKCVNGVVQGPVTINIIGIPISSADIIGTLDENGCDIHITLSSGSDDVSIAYNGVAKS